MMDERSKVLDVIAEGSKASQGHRELACLLRVVDKIQPKVIVEIGVHRGYSLQAWEMAFHPEILIGIDNDLHDLKWNGAEIMDRDSHDPFTLALVQTELSDQKIDFLFIDGDHTYEGVKQDFLMYSPLVRKGGLIALDDMDLFDNESVEVHRFWNEIKEHHAHDYIHDDSNGIGLLYV